MYYFASASHLLHLHFIFFPIAKIWGGLSRPGRYDYYNHVCKGQWSHECLNNSNTGSGLNSLVACSDCLSSHEFRIEMCSQVKSSMTLFNNFMVPRQFEIEFMILIYCLVHKIIHFSCFQHREQRVDADLNKIITVAGLNKINKIILPWA